MIVYTDLLSNDVLLSDSFPCKEIENGMLWEVQGKWVVQGASDVDIGANPSAEGAEEDKVANDRTIKIVHIINMFRLQERPPLDRKQFLKYMKRYIKKLNQKLDAEKRDVFKEHIVEAAMLLLSMIKDLRFFVGASMNDDGAIVFAYHKNGAVDPTFLYLAYGLKEISVKD